MPWRGCCKNTWSRFPGTANARCPATLAPSCGSKRSRARWAAIAAGLCLSARVECRRHWRLRRGGISRVDFVCAQPAVPRTALFNLRFKPVHAVLAMGRAGDPCAGHRRPRRDVHRHHIRAGSEGAWRAGSHGRHLLQEWRDPADRRGCEISCVGVVDWQRCGRWTRGADHPDWFSVRFHVGTVDPHVDGSAHHPGCSRRRRRHRGDVQHTHWRCAVRHRADDAGDQCEHVHAGGTCDRHRDIHRAVVLRRYAGIRRTDEPRDLACGMEELGDPAVLRGTGRADGRRSSGVCPRIALGGGPVRQDPRKLSAAHHRHADGGRTDLRADAMGSGTIMSRAWAMRPSR